jgi:hypothetical protein
MLQYEMNLQTETDNHWLCGGCFDSYYFFLLTYDIQNVRVDWLNRDVTGKEWPWWGGGAFSVGSAHYAEKCCSRREIAL